MKIVEHQKPGFGCNQAPDLFDVDFKVVFPLQVAVGQGLSPMEFDLGFVNGKTRVRAALSR
jgi:hypothetical protein